MAYSVGIDLAAVAEVEESLARFGDRYLRRVFTSRELESCGSSALRLAESFAAKEAAMKALGATDRLPWPSIELVPIGSGHTLRISGAAAQRAEEAGLRDLFVSITNAAGHAAAVVIAEAT